MAKITKKNVLSVQGIVNIENGKITFSVEDIEGGRNLKFLHTKDLKASLMTSLYLECAKIRTR